MPYFKRRDDKDKTHPMMVNRVSDEEEWAWDWEDNWEKYDYINIYGHESSKKVKREKNYICIDTSCVYGGELTALNLGNLETISVKLNKKDTTI